MVGCPSGILDLWVARNIRFSGNRQLQLRIETYNALNPVVYSNRVA